MAFDFKVLLETALQNVVSMAQKSEKDEVSYFNPFMHFLVS